MGARHPSGAGLLFFDLDDTIIQSGSHISSRVLDALSLAHSAGYALSIASGRPLCSINKQLLDTGVMDFAVCANGAAVVRLSDRKDLRRKVMSREDALCCMDLLAQFDPAWNGFFDNKAFFEWKGTSYMLTGRVGAIARVRRYAPGSRGTLRRVVWLAKRGVRYVMRMATNRSHKQVPKLRPHVARAKRGVQKIGCTIASPESCLKAQKVLMDDGRFEVVRMGATELEITARGVTKGTGAAFLMETLGIDPARTVAFGDGGNDLPLASAVGTFVAMENADSEVKAAADEVCPSVVDDGVAVWIRKRLLGLADE